MAHGRVVRRDGVEVCVAAPEVSLGEATRWGRLGITIRHGAAKGSVGRNRLKRWVRESFRRHPESAAPGCDLVVRVTHPLGAQDHHRFEALLLSLLKEACKGTP